MVQRQTAYTSELIRGRASSRQHLRSYLRVHGKLWQPLLHLEGVQVVWEPSRADMNLGTFKTGDYIYHGYEERPFIDSVLEVLGAVHPLRL